MLLVVADNYQQAKHFASSAKLKSGTWRFISDDTQLRGYSKATPVVIFGASRMLGTLIAADEAKKYFELVMFISDIG